MSLSDNTHQIIERWIEQYARIGYGAKGIIYGTVGLLAFMQSFDLVQGETVGSEGALRTVADQPYGKVMLVVLALSLLGYVVWRLIQAILDPEHSGYGFGDMMRRLSYLCSAVAYMGVALSAVKILKDPSGSQTASGELALRVMHQPFGRWLLATAGLIVCGIGCYYFYRAIKAEFRKRFRQHLMSDTAKTWATIAGRVGIAARGFVYVVIGAYGIRAAWAFDPSMIKTTEGALAVFDNNPADEWILATLGLGFIAYGIHMGFQAVYRSIDPL